MVVRTVAGNTSGMWLFDRDSYKKPEFAILPT
jgi:hypothetical protein